MPPELLSDLRALIETSRHRAARAVNAEMVLLHWHVGQRIHREILNEERAGYGEQIIEGLSRRLTAEFDRGFGRRNLFSMVAFAVAFSDELIVQTLSAQLSWSHFLEILPLKGPLQREFYSEMCRIERWSVRVLRDKVRGMLFERTALSRQPEQLVAQELAALRDTDRMGPDLIFRDPYVLDFLGLPGNYSERDLETAILRELESFLLELGTDFAFLARQKRITIDGEDYHIDLLFYHRRLRRLVVVELKLGPFRAADKGQVELYLRWLEKYEQRPGEESPLGLILCAEKSSEHVELLQLERSGIRVAEYLTELPSAALLQDRLQQAIRRARETRSSTPEGGAP